MVAQESPTVAYLAGGVTGSGGPVSKKVVRVEQGPSGVTATLVTSDAAARYCGCALLDPKRQELVVIGGRGSNFSETANAEIVDLKTGTVSPLDAGTAAGHPVGCHAVFLPDRDEGYVFGGASQASGFTGSTWRYTPADHQFTLLTGPTPTPRYDGVLRYPAPGGAVWLVSGMGSKFLGDVWKLDPASGSWAQLATTGMGPPGRRMPFVAFAGDLSAVVMGFGSDSAQGKTMLGDLWKLDLAALTWSQVPRTTDPQPPPRGFAMWLPGPKGSAGLISGGLLAAGPASDVLVVQPPVPGDWR